MAGKKSEGARRKPGRPVVGEGKRYAVTFRITKTMRDALETASRLNGRSISQEAEFRMEHSERAFKDALVHAYGRQGAGVIELIGRLMQGEGDWLEDRHAFMRVCNRINAVLYWLRAEDAPRPQNVTYKPEEDIPGLAPITARKPTAAWLRANTELRELLGDPAMQRLWLRTQS